MRQHPTIRRRVAMVVVGALAVLSGPLLVAAPAAADGAPTQIVFATTSPLETAFGGNWVARANTTYSGYDYPVPASAATVSVFIAGVTDAFVTGLPIQPDGAVYITQPVSKPPLAAGQYQLTAVIVPVAGSNVAGSQTSTPLVLTVSAYALSTTLAVDQGSGTPVIVAGFSGDYVDTTKSAPAGTWSFTVKHGSKKVLSQDVAQAAGGTDPLRVPIDAKLDEGTEYQVEAKFAAVDSIAPGLNLTQAKPVTFRTPSADLTSPVPFPLWALILVAVLFAALIAAAITLQVTLQRRRNRAADVVDELPRTAPEPVVTYVEPVVHDPAPWVPDSSPPAPTRVLPSAPHEPGAFTQLIQGSVPPAEPAPPAEPPTRVLPPASEPSPHPPAADVSGDPDDPDDADAGSWSLLK